MDSRQLIGIATAEPAAIFDRRSHVAFAVLLAFGAGLAGWAVYAGWGRDFQSFYLSARALAEGKNPYQVVIEGTAVNLNLPHTTLVMVPLTYLPFPVAFGAWQFVSLCAWASVLRHVSKTRRFTPEAAAAAALFPGTLAQIALGQWGFLLAWMVVMAWRAHRRGQALVSGAWVGLGAAVKPFIALLLLVLIWRGERRAVFTAIPVAAAVFIAGWLLLGSQVYDQWRDATTGMTWAAIPANGSLLGFAARTFSGVVAHVVWTAVAAIVLIVTVLMCRRSSSDASAWTAALAAALLVSPLGWIYYAWIVVPSLFSLDRWSAFLKVGILVLFVPPGLAPALSTASIGLLLIWMALVLEMSRGRPNVEVVAVGAR